MPDAVLEGGRDVIEAYAEIEGIWINVLGSTCQKMFIPRGLERDGSSPRYMEE